VLLGSLLLFNHDVLHEGGAVSTASKYVIKTELMFKRFRSSTSEATPERLLVSLLLFCLVLIFCFAVVVVDYQFVCFYVLYTTVCLSCFLPCQAIEYYKKSEALEAKGQLEAALHYYLLV